MGEPAEGFDISRAQFALLMIVAIGLLAALMPLGGTFWLAVILSIVIDRHDGWMFQGRDRFGLADESSSEFRLVQEHAG